MNDDTEYAFPSLTPYGLCGGMTLRDWFAGQSLVGISTGGDLTMLIAKSNNEDRNLDDAISEYAYKLAEAMIEARK